MMSHLLEPVTCCTRQFLHHLAQKRPPTRNIAITAHLPIFIKALRYHNVTQLFKKYKLLVELPTFCSEKKFNYVKLLTKLCYARSQSVMLLMLHLFHTPQGDPQTIYQRTGFDERQIKGFFALVVAFLL